MLKRHIYIPIEIIPRELDSKILLSLSAVQKGYRVYIGSKDSINKLLVSKKKNDQKAGIFFYKSQFIQGYDYMSKLVKQSCNKFVVLDEELGPVVKDINSVIKKRLKNLSNIDQFYVIGDEFYKEILKRKKKFKNIFYKTGWPRVDLWLKKDSNFYKKKVKEIKKKYGNFILFSSDFGAISKKGLKIHLKNFKKDTNLRPWANTIKKSYKDYLEFKNFIKNVSKISNKKIVIRPHPSDLFHSDWQKEFKNEKKIDVIYDDDISPWILASSDLLHRGCTTAIQAFFYDKPIYYWKSKSSLGKKDKTLSYFISEKIKGLDEFRNSILINKKNSSYSGKFKINELIKKKISLSKKENACEKIIKNLDKLKVKSEKPFKKKFIENYKNLLLDKIYRYSIKMDIKKDDFSKSYIQKYPHLIDKKIVKEKAKLLFPKNNFKIKNITMNLVEIEN